MGRLFRALSSQYFSVASVPTSGYPFSVGVFFRPATLSLTNNWTTIMSYGDAVDAGGGHRLGWTGGAYSLGTGFSARSSASGIDKEAHIGIFGSVTVWNWVLMTHTDSATCSLYVVQSGSITSDTRPADIAPSMDYFNIGRFYAAGVGSDYLGGAIAYLSIWNHDFSSTEVTDYWGHAATSNKGYIDPRLIKPTNLVFCWPGYALSSGSADDVDVIGGRVLTNGNSPTFADDPPLQRQMGI